MGDLKEGFNQCDNEPGTARKMAVLVASGTYLPKGLTFGSNNGPEDFQELVFIIFARRLYREWFLFLDDLSVATGRPDTALTGPSGAEDVVGATMDREVGHLLAQPSRPAVSTGVKGTALRAMALSQLARTATASSVSEGASD